MSTHSDQPPDSHHVRRVTLPSGRAIEVVYFDEPDTPAPTATVALHVCPTCSGEFVYPVHWHETSDTHWEVELRCPNCEWSHVGDYDQDCLDRFDEQLDRGIEAIVRDLRRLTRANMENELERFRAALDADAVWPMDF